MTKKTDLPDNVRAFTPKMKKKEDLDMDAATTEELMEKGLEIFVEELSKDAKGFFSVIFDKDDHPRLLWVGDIDMVMALGSLELAKNELFNNVLIDLE